MSETIYIINLETGRRIRVGKVTFNHLIFTSHNFINGELIRRATAPSRLQDNIFLIHKLTD